MQAKKNQHAKVTHPNNEQRNVICRCNDYNENNGDYDKSDNNIEYYDSSNDDNDTNDTSDVSKNGGDEQTIPTNHTSKKKR